MSSPRVLPRPGHTATEDARFQVRPDTAVCCGANDATRRVARRLGDLFEREAGLALDVRPGERHDDSIDLRVDESQFETADPEAYRIRIGDDHVTVRAPSADGLHYAAVTLAGRLTASDGAWELPAGDVTDRPSHGWRGLLVDPARGFVPLDALKRTVDRMARAKLNRLHLHLLDTWSYCLESDSFPKLEEPPDDDRPEDLSEAEMTEFVDRTYDPEEIEELVAYCHERGVEVVPEIEFPGHATHVLEKYPQLGCDVPDGEASDFTVCAGAEATYEFVDTLVEEVTDQFPGDVLHIGGDEFADHASWDECSRCQRRMEEEGLSDLTELFYYFLRRVHDSVASRDRRLMVWNDNIDVSESPDLPDDVIVQFWRVALEGHGPVEGCSLGRFLEEGFDVVNSYVPAVYVDGPMDPEYLVQWTPTSRPAVPDEYADQVLGSEMTAWGGWCPGGVFTRESYEAYYRRALPSAVPVFGDRVWNATGIDDRQQFSRDLTRHVLGPHVPEGFDLFERLGGPVLPTADFERAHADRRLADATPEEIRAESRSAIEVLDRGPRTEGAPFPDAVAEYRDALEWLAEVATADERGMFYRHSSLVEFPP